MLSRRTFLGKVLTVAGGGLGMGLGLSACPLPKATPDLNRIVVGLTPKEIYSLFERTREPYHDEKSGFFLVPYDTSGRAGRRYVEAGVAAAGLIALRDRCTGERCRVRFCVPSQWFECPCHGEKYNRAGEYKLGPTERGLDRLKMTVRNDQVTVFVKEVVPGPDRSVNTTGQEKEGPFCV
ncbi:MAG: ubiquinol-cytochrome c reductase iron-sulfur subunit [Actinomycetota bacterium]